MTLHEAIEQVLKEASTNMTAKEIADEINVKQLYQRKDGSLVQAVQIYARIAQYEHLFEIKPNRLIGFVDRNILAYKDLVKRLSNFLISTSLSSNSVGIVLPTLIYLTWKKKSALSTSYTGTQKEKLFHLFEEIEFGSHNKPLLFDQLQHFEGLQERQIGEIFKMITSSGSEDMPVAEFGPFFNELINDPSWRDTFRARANWVPKHLVSLISKIAKIGDLPFVYDPYAGNASLLVGLLNENTDKTLFIQARDNNLESVMLGSLNLLANGCNNSIYFYSFDLMDKGADDKFGCIVSTPPFAGRLKETFTWNSYGEVIQTSDLLSAAVVNIVDQLKDKGGRAYITVPIGFLFRQDKFVKDVRRFLIKEKLLTGIIALPQGLFKPYAGVLTALLVIDTQKGISADRLLYYDLTSSNPEVISTNVSEIVNLLYSEEHLPDGNNYSFFDYALIEERKFRLDKSLYINTQRSYLKSYEINLTGKVGSLKSFLDGYYQGLSIKPSNLNTFEGIPYIQVSDLSGSHGVDGLDPSKVKRFVSDIELINGNPRYIAPNSILVSKVGTSLHSVLYKSNDKVLCSNNIIVLQPSPAILPEYLAAVLENKSIVEQVDMIRNLTGMPSFRLSDFINISINVPTIKEQAEYLVEFFTQLSQELRRFTEEEKDEDLYNIISRMKHELMQSVSSLGIDIRLIKEYLKQKERDSDTVTSQDLLITILPGMEKETIDRSRLGAVLNRMAKCQEDANETLVKAEETLLIGISSFSPKEFKLKSYLKEEIMALYENANCEIRIIGDEEIIKGDKYQLKVLFKNLIDNAIKHGFESKKLKTNNIINIHLNKIDPSTRYHEIVVENNGTPFPAGFDLSLFETRGTSDGKNKGTGFGGYHIKKVIENHKGMMKIAKEEEVGYTDFKVKFIIHLPE